MNACLQFDPPGLRGPEDQPEYDGPSVDDITTQFMSSPVFVQTWATDIPEDVFAQLIAGDDLTFAHRFRYEMRRIAEREAQDDFDREYRKFMEEAR